MAITVAVMYYKHNLFLKDRASLQVGMQLTALWVKVNQSEVCLTFGQCSMGKVSDIQVHV